MVAEAELHHSDQSAGTRIAVTPRAALAFLAALATTYTALAVLAFLAFLSAPIHQTQTWKSRTPP